MSATNQQIITEAFQKLGIVTEGKQPSATQSNNALTIFNDNMATQVRDGWRGIGWYPQTTLNAIAPLKDEDIGDVKLVLASWIGIHYGIAMTPPLSPDDTFSLSGQIKAAFVRLNKRYLQFFECDLGELSRPQGGPWGGPNWL